MKKILTITILAVMITMGLFAFMAFLISSDKVQISPSGPDVFLGSYSLPERSKPKPPKTVPVKPKATEIPKTTPPVTIGKGDILYHDPEISIHAEAPTLDFMQSQKNVDHDAQPILRIDPKYPMDAARKGIEGWVQLSFDVNKVGEVINVEVISSEPKRVFEKSAKRALSKWKYQAKVIEGEYVMQKDLSVQLDFQIDKAG